MWKEKKMIYDSAPDPFRSPDEMARTRTRMRVRPWGCSLFAAISILFS